MHGSREFFPQTKPSFAQALNLYFGPNHLEMLCNAQVSPVLDPNLDVTMGFNPIIMLGNPSLFSVPTGLFQKILNTTMEICPATVKPVCLTLLFFNDLTTSANSTSQNNGARPFNAQDHNV